MLRDFLMWLMRILMQMIMWIFILSISWDGRTLFDRGYDLFVDNPIIHLLDSQARELWDTVTETARLSYNQITNKDNGDSRD